MEFAKVNAKYYCGIDLHSRTMYVCVKNKEGDILFHRNMPNKFSIFKNYIKQFLPDLAVGVESSCYYYWLADACRGAGIPFYLGHALYMKAIHGGKAKNDLIDSRTIADLLRVNMFPLAYPYPKEMRAARDLLRKRHYFVSQRAGTYSHIQMVFVQQGMLDIDPKSVKDKEHRKELIKVFTEADLQLMVSSDLNYIDSLDAIIAPLERHIRNQARYHNGRDYTLLMTIPGVGEMLALVILYETHDVNRFRKVQRFSSYSGVVKCERRSAGKVMATKNNKIRNAYLKWAFGEIILKAQVSEPRIAKLYERLKSKYGPGRAKSIIAHRFAVATYFMLKNKEVFDVERFCQSSKYK